MFEIDRDQLADEVFMCLSFLRSNVDPESIPSGHPAEKFLQLSDKQLLQLVGVLAPLVEREIDQGHISSLDDLPEYFLNLMSVADTFSHVLQLSSVYVSGGSGVVASQMEDGARLFYRKALKKMEFEQYDEARMLLKRSIELWDGYAPAWEALSTTFERCGMLEQSRVAAERAAQIRANS